MSNEPLLHSNVPSIPQEQFDSLRGHFLYVSHRLLTSLEILTQKKVGRTSAHRYPESTIFTEEECDSLEALLTDLERRLRQMFVVDETKAEKMRAQHAAGKMRKVKKEA